MTGAAVKSSPLDLLREKLGRLTDEQKQAFFSLSYVNFPKNKDPAKDIDELALAIFSTNAVIAGEEVGVFPRMARLNHGCSSGFNAVYSFRPTEGTLYVHAIKPIAKGEVSDNSEASTRGERLVILVG